MPPLIAILRHLLPAARRHPVRGASAEQLEQRRLLSFSVSSAALLGPQFTPGTKWMYQWSAANNGDVYSDVTTVAGPDTFQGQNVTRIDSVNTYTAGPASGIVSRTSAYYAPSNGQTISYGHTASSNDGPNDTFTDSPYSAELPANLEIGQTYTSKFTETGVYVFSNSPTVTQISDVTLTFTLNSEATQPITVPAGTFNCYEVDVTSVGTVRDLNFTSNVSSRSYYAPGIGMVKEESDITNPLQESILALTNFEPAPHKLGFVQGPSDAIAGKTLTPVVVSILDADGNLESAGSDSGNKVMLSISGDGVLHGTTSVNAVGGVATFSDLSVSNGGTYKLTASSDVPITSTLSGTFNVTGETGVLKPTLLKATAPAAAVGGGKVDIAANVLVANNGDASITGMAKISSFLVGPGDATDRLQIGKTISQRVNLKPRAAAHLTEHLTSLPTVATPGKYAVEFIVTDPKGNTATALGPNIMVGPAVVTLSESIAALKIPSTITIGQKLKAASIKLIVKNSGNVIAKGKTTFSVSASTVSGVVGTAITSAPVTLNTAPGKTKPVTINIKSLPTLAAGSYFIVIQATDSMGNKSIVSSASPITVSA